MRRYSSLEADKFQVSSSKSLHSEHGRYGVASILKDPSKSKLKHNKSVHFEDFEPLSSEESFNSPTFCQQQTKQSVTRQNFLNFYCPKLIKTPAKEKLNQNHTNSFKKSPNSDKGKSPQNVSPSKKKFIKVVSAKKINKMTRISVSPIVVNSVINFEFRDQRFYKNLNKFISVKEPGKEEISKKTEMDKEECKPGHVATRSTEIYLTRSEKNHNTSVSSIRQQSKPPLYVDKKHVQLNVRYMKP